MNEQAEFEEPGRNLISADFLGINRARLGCYPSSLGMP
jgi:hypothetical protein